MSGARASSADGRTRVSSAPIVQRSLAHSPWPTTRPPLRSLEPSSALSVCTSIASGAFGRARNSATRRTTGSRPSFQRPARRLTRSSETTAGRLDAARRHDRPAAQRRRRRRAREHREVERLGRRLQLAERPGGEGSDDRARIERLRGVARRSRRRAPVRVAFSASSGPSAPSAACHGTAASTALRVASSVTANGASAPIDAEPTTRARS